MQWVFLAELCASGGSRRKLEEALLVRDGEGRIDEERRLNEGEARVG